jgi:nitronate monooxygenase
MTFQELFDVESPLIQAPMAGSQLSAMAIAVANEGALGSLPCAMLSADAMLAEIGKIRSGTQRPYNLNFFCHTSPPRSEDRLAAWSAALAPYYREFGIAPPAAGTDMSRKPFSADIADALAQIKPPVVSFHFGLPSTELLARVRSWGSKIVSSATTVAEAKWLEARGVDAIVAQGVEAGGHRGMFLSDDVSTQVGTFALLPQIVRSVRVPVIAAGGIADRQGVAAAMALGAIGVQVGTAFLLCPEANTSAVYRAALQSEQSRHTQLTNLFSGRPARSIVNRLMRDFGGMSPIVPPFPLATAALLPLREYSERHGSGDFSPLWSGQNPTGCKPVPAAQIVRELMGTTISR